MLMSCKSSIFSSKCSKYFCLCGWVQMYSDRYPRNRSLHSLKVQTDFGKSCAMAACTAVLMYLIILFALVATKMAGHADGCVTWRDLLSPVQISILVGLGVLAALNVILPFFFNVSETHMRSGAVSMPPSPPLDTTTNPAAPVHAAAGGGTLSAATSASLSAATSGSAPKGASQVGKVLTPLEDKEQASSYLIGVQEVVSKIGEEAEELAAAAQDVRSIEEKPLPTEAEMQTLHAVSGELLDKFRDVPDRLTAQVKALRSFETVYGNLLEAIEKGHQQVEEETAKHKAYQDATAKEFERFSREMDQMLEPTHRILLGETVCKLAVLAEQHIYQGKSTGKPHKLKLQQLQRLYENNELNAAQEGRWEEVVKFVSCCLSMDDLLLVEKHLRTVRFGAAHGFEDEKKATTLKHLQSWAKMHYSQEEFPDVHKPLQSMLEMLAGFSSIGRPCLPDRSFELMLYTTLQRKK